VTCFICFYSTICKTSSLFWANLFCFLTFFEGEEKMFVKNINRLVFLMEIYVFSVKLNWSLKLFKWRILLERRKKVRTKSVDRMADFQHDVRNTDLQNRKQECRNRNLYIHWFYLVQFLLLVHISFVKINCVSRVTQFISIYAFGAVSFFAPEFWEDKHWKNDRLINVRTYRKWEICNGYLVCEEI